MEQLLKQTRLKFSGAAQQKAEGTSNVRDRKIPPQKTQSFKGDKRSQSWLQRQFTKQTSRSDGNGGEDELAAAVAAAAFAVSKLEDSAMPDRTPTGAVPERTLTKAKSKRQEGSTQLETGDESRKHPDRKISITVPAPPPQKRPTFSDKHLESTEDAKEGARTPPKPSPSIKKASSSADKQFKKTTSMKTEISSSPTPEPLPTIRPTPPPPLDLKTRQSPAFPGGESKADAWIREELSRIKERYDKVNSTIESWETNKKKKARGKLDATESKLQRKRAKAMQTFRAEMDNIEHTVAGAREQAEKRRKNEELKVRDKANRIRTTGKLPTTCLCF